MIFVIKTTSAARIVQFLINDKGGLRYIKRLQRKHIKICM